MILCVECSLIASDTRANLNYLDQLSKFHMARNGTNLNRFPSVDKRPLDLYKLKKFVEDKGGFDAVCRQKRWAEIGRDLGYSGKIMSSLSTSLKNSYQKWLQPYEDWLRYNKASILQQQEIENGGPYTPSPAQTPAKSQQQTPHVGPPSPAVRASSALNAALHAAVPQRAASEGPVPTPPAHVQAPPPAANGFTPVNASSFTAVNARPLSAAQPAAPIAAPSAPPASIAAPSSHPPTFAAVNHAMSGVHKAIETAQSTPQRSEMSPLTSMENTPERGYIYPPPANIPILYQVPNNQRLINALKRNFPMDGEENGDASNGGKSKRMKSDSVPVIAGSGMVQPRLPAPRLQLPRDRSQEKPGDLCEECGRGDDDPAILICDNCDNGYHRYCLRPPLKAVPEQDWFCPRCVFGRGEYGFEEGAVYSLKQFQEKAKHFKENHFFSKVPVEAVTGIRRPPTEEDVEREFWRLTESLTETVEVEYGADIHSTTHGSAFPTLELQASDPYAVDVWNLNVLPLDKESLFRHIKTDISGMTVPWLYVGMCFSTFCWHSEDHYAYSINYQHFGETKTWYGIPGEDAEKFEAAMREKIPEMFEQQPDLLFQLVTLLQPEKLQKAGVRVSALDQRAGQFVITFPQAYHAGFNHGFNFNEAVNFAPADWEPFGASSIIRLQDYRRQPVFCHEELLMSAASRDHSIKTAKWLGPALQRMLDREMQIRQSFTLEYSKAKHTPADNAADDDSVIGNDAEFTFEKDEKDYIDDDIVCTYCKAYCFLSRFVCKKTNRIVCLLHAGKFECCESMPPDERTSLKDGEHYIQLRLTDEELTAAVQKVVDVSRTPEIWNEKLDKSLKDGPKAQLKLLRSLVTEGERINQHWDLTQLPELRRYVERCNEWVEEATNYITRKQQNRRKNERAWRKNSTKAIEEQEREKELRNVDNIKRLLEQADSLSFECPELETLQERADKINDFRKRVSAAVKRDNIKTSELEELIEESKTFGVDMPEIETLETRARRTKWYERANEAYDKFTKGAPLSLQEVEDFIKEGRDVGLPDRDEHLRYFIQQQEQGTFWEQKVKELMVAEPINYAQLDTLARQATMVPVSKETLAAIDAILAKQREAQDKINNLFQRCRDPDFRKRPKYQEVREAMESLTELNNKPPGTMDLEKEQKRHEDWMRRGKKLFGKANAPLHILLQHMKIVEERNEYCLDVNDEPRLPVEPSSRANSPSADQDDGLPGTGREVFCICRKPEAGMMIECEMCHEWYANQCCRIE
jgi:histone demethylase JARID1